MVKQFIKLRQLGRFFITQFTIVPMELLYVFYTSSTLDIYDDILYVIQVSVFAFFILMILLVYGLLRLRILGRDGGNERIASG